MLEQIDADDGGRNAGRVRQRRHFIAEKRAGNNRTRRHRQIGMKRRRHTHESNADGGASGQTAADGHTDDGAECKGGEIEISGGNQPETVIHQRRNRAAHHQRADHQSDEEKQVNRAHALPHRTDHAFLHVVIFQPAREAVEDEDGNGGDDGHMGQPAQRNDGITHRSD